jgi:hypothetical protein
MGDVVARSDVAPVTDRRPVPRGVLPRGSVPLCDVDAVRAALAEENDGHGELVYAWGEQNTKLGEDSEFCGGSIAGPAYFMLLPRLRVREKLHQRFSDPR